MGFFALISLQWLTGRKTPSYCTIRGFLSPPFSPLVDFPSLRYVQDSTAGVSHDCQSGLPVSDCVRLEARSARLTSRRGQAESALRLLPFPLCSWRSRLHGLHALRGWWSTLFDSQAPPGLVLGDRAYGVHILFLRFAGFFLWLFVLVCLFVFFFFFFFFFVLFWGV